jgi:uncharacterized protein
MKEVIKGLIAEFLEWDIPRPIKRLIAIPDLPQEIRKVVVFVGMRRTGKTWLMYQQMQDLLEQGWKKSQLLYINFEDDRLANFTSSDFQLILDAYFDLNPHFSKETKLAFFFDEIHIVSGWEKFVRRLIDQERMKVFVTGSSAKMLSKEIATTLRGRAWPLEVFPCSFHEFVSFKGVSSDAKLTSKTCSLLRHLAQTYLIYGGFPEVLFLPHELHSALLQGYMNTVVFKDVVERYQIKNAHIVKVFLLHCLKQLAAPLSVTKMFNNLKSQGETVGKNSLFKYLDYFEDAYALFTVPLFHSSEKARQVNPKKLYGIDPGLITAYSIKQAFEKASRLENAVFVHLRREHKEISYYKTQNHQEVDFVVTTQTGDFKLFQVCVEMSNAQTRAREFLALQEAAQQLGLKQGFVITEDHEETIEETQITIHCIPFWKWAF